MINNKEDLYNTFIVNDHGELRDLYLELCDKFGLNWLSGKPALLSEVGFKSKFICVLGEGTISADGLGDMVTISELKEKSKQESDYDKGMREAMRKIAVSCGRVFGANIGYEDLPDLVESMINPVKPKRMRVDYVKVDFEFAWQALKAFEDGEKLFRDKNQTLSTNVVEFVEAASVGGIGYILTYYKADNLYRRTEVEVSERDEFIEAFIELGNENPAINNEAFAGLVFDKLVEGE